MNKKNPDVILRFGKKLPPKVKSADGSKKQEQDWSDQNLYDDTIVLLDEAHNAVKEQSQYRVQLEKLCDALKRTNENTRVVFLTATPAPAVSCGNQAVNGRSAVNPQKLLNLVKGARDVLLSRTNEGYVSHYDGLVGFPKILTTKRYRYGLGFQESAMGTVGKLPYRVANVVRVPMGSGVYLRYLRTWMALSDHNSLGDPASKKRLLARGVVWMPPQSASREDQKAKLFSTSEDHNSSVEAFASKVYRVGDRVREMELKALVLVSKQQGFNTVVDILGEMVGKTRVLSLREKSQVAGTMEKFNADNNLRGQKYLVLVADTDTCGEGVSFMSVLILSLKKYW